MEGHPTPRDNFTARLYDKITKNSNLGIPGVLAAAMLFFY